uniref:Uncharacterized protein LOC111137919 n=1 Tax=Crassostrea virginica TaxID=6565 RepID=A0A8B8EZ42_CRAVI|nr:uncharacterized protein LOC111137919 [Crassostrea virginica]
MAKGKEEYPLGTPQVHISLCEKHDLMPIDMMCEECYQFNICSQCVKEDHEDHKCSKIATALTARTLEKFMTKIEEVYMENLDEKILKASQQIETNNEKYEIEIAKIQTHFDAMVEIMKEKKQELENFLKHGLEEENSELSKVKSNLEKKKRKVLGRVKYIRENINTMYDTALVKSQRELTKLIYSEDDDVNFCTYSGSFQQESIDEKLLVSIMGNAYYP